MRYKFFSTDFERPDNVPRASKRRPRRFPVYYAVDTATELCLRGFKGFFKTFIFVYSRLDVSCRKDVFKTLNVSVFSKDNNVHCVNWEIVIFILT